MFADVDGDADRAATEFQEGQRSGILGSGDRRLSFGLNYRQAKCQFFKFPNVHGEQIRAVV